MKSIIRVIILFLAVACFACEEEEDCVGCNLNPRIKLKFEATTTREVFDSLLTKANEDIVVFVDSLKTQLGDEDRNEIIDLLSSLREDSAKYGEAVSLFKAGRINISAIEAPGSSGFEQFQDTVMSAFFIPVDMKNDVSTYYFNFHDLVDTLQLNYHREIQQSIDGVRMRLSGIEVNRENSTFDSIRVKCYKADCGNDLTTVYIYF